MITHLQEFLKNEVVEFQVRREYVYLDLLKESKKSKFHPMKRVQVFLESNAYDECAYLKQTWFIGEMGRDTGGITRELWKLFGESLERLCIGEENMLVFRPDSNKVIVRVLCNLVTDIQCIHLTEWRV